MFKNSLAILDVMTSNPDRPIYFNFTSMNQIGLDLERFLVQEGEVFRVDFQRINDASKINTRKMYDNLMLNADYSNLLDPDTNFTYEDFQLRMISPLRQSFNVLVTALLQENEPVKANEVMDHALKYLYGRHIKPTFADLQTADLLFRLGRHQDAELVAQRLWDWTNARVTEAERSGKSAEDYDLYLLQNSAEIISLLHDSNSTKSPTPFQ